MKKQVRCAIYTRKSTEEGLDQAFNSRHAQREACEAYVLSQAGEGWIALPDVYDDGGFSGGNMERPGLKRLLAEIRAQRIDVVVVYKVDRLTRALSDFARIVEQFDDAGVSFVSVTQAFNTTSSMGRLTLNVLLSFAQFEREVTGERIRDKIAASKKKGMWMGGALPLGYDPPTDPTTRALVIHSAEAETVRMIFAKYLELGSVHLLAAWLAGEGVVSKLTTSKAGVVRGGTPFNRGSLFHLLKNRTYLGEIPHKEQTYPGSHAPIVDREIFEAVQIQLAKGATTQHARRKAGSGSSPLKGIIFDADGRIMSPAVSTNGRGRPYRYYVSTTVQRGERGARSDDIIQRVSATSVEAMVTDRVGRLCPGVEPFPDGVVSRVDVLSDYFCLTLRPDRLPQFALHPDGVIARLRGRLRDDEQLSSVDGALRLIVAVKPKLRGGRTELVSNSDEPTRARVHRDAPLIRALRTAHARVKELESPSATSVKLGSDYDRRMVHLAFLAPDIQGLILEGRQPLGMNLQSLRALDLPIAWEEQRSLLLR